MPESIDTLVSEAMQLRLDQRMTPAHRILSSVEPVPTSEIAAAWDAKIRERIPRNDGGRIGSIPAAEVGCWVTL